MSTAKKMGRPTEIDGPTKKYSVTLDNATTEKAKRLGRGNLSAGLRDAVRRARIGKEP